MSKSVTVVWNDALSAYNFGPTHPFSPVRVALAIRLADEFGLLDHSNVTMLSEFASATDDQLLTVHTPELLAAVKQAGEDPERVPRRAVRDRNRRHSCLPRHAFRRCPGRRGHIGGRTAGAGRDSRARGEHRRRSASRHARTWPAASASTTTSAVAIQWLLDQGVERIAYVDVDVHHGDGVQAAFWDDPAGPDGVHPREPRDAVPGDRPSRLRSAGRMPAAARSTSPSRPVPGTRGGCAPSTR